MNIFKDKDGKTVIGQRPNWPILVAITFWVISKLTAGGLSDLLYFGFLIFLALWAILELLKGVNYFRKLLGLATLFFIVFVLISKF